LWIQFFLQRYNMENVPVHTSNASEGKQTKFLFNIPFNYVDNINI